MAVWRQGEQDKLRTLALALDHALGLDLTWDRAFSEWDGHRGALPRSAHHSWRGVARRVAEAETRYGTTLQRYVDTWLQAGRHFGRWQERNPELYRRLERENRKYTYEWCSDPDGRAQFVWGRQFPPGRGLEGMEAYQAAKDFLDLASSALRHKFLKCDRCGSYFVNQSGHTNKRYCRRSCATRASAERTTRNRRARERAEKIGRARRALDQFTRLRRRPEDWKGWVARRSRLTTKWLTRAINRGDLKEPRINK